jgi:biotin carboxyl carrier protein
VEYTLRIDNEDLAVHCEIEGDDRFRFSIEGQDYDVSATAIDRSRLYLAVNGQGSNVFLAEAKRGKTVGIGGEVFFIEEAEDGDKGIDASGAEETVREITPPMPSVVVRTLVKEGDQVDKGQAVIVVSAMKMETTLTAPFKGRVTQVHVKEGDQVAVGQILVDLEPLPEEN